MAGRAAVAAWLSQADDSLQNLSLDEARYSTPRTRPSRLSPIPPPQQEEEQSLFHSSSDPFESSWKATSVLISPSSSVAATSPPIRKRTSHQQQPESAQKKAEKFLSLATTTLATPTLALREDEALNNPCGIFSTTPILLRNETTGKYLQEDYSAPGYVLEECELMLEKSSSSSSTVIHFGDLVWLRFKQSGKYLGENGQVMGGEGKERAASWFVRPISNSTDSSLVVSNSSISLEHSDGQYLCWRGHENMPQLGSQSVVWNVVRSNGPTATCYLPPLIEFRATTQSSNVECLQLLDVFLGVDNTGKLLVVGFEDMQVLAQHIAYVRRFIARNKGKPELGRVVSALCFYLEERVLDPFHEYIATLCLEPNPTITLLINLIQPRCRLLADWSRLLRSFNLQVLRGGALINALQEAKQWAFESSRDCERAIEACLYPYFEMLNLWLVAGKVEDPFQEFMIRFDATCARESLAVDVNSRYWNYRFRIHADINAIPWFLQPEADLILKIGRNVDAMSSNTTRQALVCTVQGKSQEIHQLFAQSNTTMLSALNGSFLPLLLCFKRFFLMEQGDFYSYFLDAAEHELASARGSHGSKRLETIFPVLFRESSSAMGGMDAFLDNFSCVMLDEAIDVHVERIQNVHLQQQQSAMREEEENLLCVDVFALDFHAPRPLDLVLTRRSITKYQLLFRHLFRCKHAERVIGQVWAVLRTNSNNNRVIATSLVQRMTQFLQSFAYYVAFEVIEPRWQAFWTKAHTCADIDSLLDCHDDFLDSCLKECLLTNPVLIRHFSVLLRLCLAFGDLFLDSNHGLAAVDVGAARVIEFDNHLQQFLLQLKTEAQKSEFRNVHLLHLASRLDYSQFYM